MTPTPSPQRDAVAGNAAPTTTESGVSATDVDGGLVVGFDLDQTLIDTRPGIAATLALAARQARVRLDIELALRNLGPAMEELLAQQLPPPGARECAAQYRRLYPSHGPRHARVLPGAREAVAAVRAHGGTVVVVTGQDASVARRHVDHAGLAVARVIGSAWGPAKTRMLAACHASVYVGDHPADMRAARAAGALAVAVTTGNHAAADLCDADVVLSTLAELPAWLAAADWLGRS